MPKKFTKPVSFLSDKTDDPANSIPNQSPYKEIRDFFEQNGGGTGTGDHGATGAVFTNPTNFGGMLIGFRDSGVKFMLSRYDREGGSHANDWNWNDAGDPANGRGTLAPPAPPVVPAPAVPPLPITSIPSIFASGSNLEPIIWALDEVIPMSALTLVYAAPGVLKSTLPNAMARAIADNNDGEAQGIVNIAKGDNNAHFHTWVGDAGGTK